MRTCLNCKQEKDDEEFRLTINTNNKEHTRTTCRANRCHECVLELCRANYYARKCEFNKFKSTLKCERCGESHVATLQFHHRDPTQKDGSISNAISRRWTHAKILSEVAKCEVLCGNCHLKEHWNQQQEVYAKTFPALTASS